MGAIDSITGVFVCFRALEAHNLFAIAFKNVVVTGARMGVTFIICDRPMGYYANELGHHL
jgi:hypothetical protein